MFKLIPNTAVPGFRVGRPDDDELGFNVADDGSTPPVLRGAPDVPTVDDNYPFGATSPGFVAPQAPSPNPVAPPATGSPLLPAGHQMPTTPMVETGFLPLDPRGYGGAFNYARYVRTIRSTRPTRQRSRPTPCKRRRAALISTRSVQPRPKHRKHKSREHRWR
jgi:hypothetical protein